MPSTTADRRKWIVLALLAMAQFVVVLDASIVNVALPSIGRGLHFSQDSLSWVVNAYVLTFGGFLLLGGRAADLLGRRRIFMIGLVVFAVASLAGGLAQSPGWLIAARAVQGFGAALLSPAALSIVTTTFTEGAERNRALGVWGAVAGSGGAAGVLLGGILTSGLGWQWVLFVNTPIGIAAALLAPRLISESRVDADRKRFDIAGAITVTAGLSILVYALVDAQKAGWGSFQTIGLLSLAVALLGAFTVIEQRSEAPLVPFRIFRSGALRRANIGAIALFGTYVSFQFLITQYLQTLAGWSALSTALAFLPAGMVVVVMSVRMSGLIGRFGPTPLVAAAFLSLVAGYAVFLRAGIRPDYPSVMLPAVALLGLAFGLGFSSLSLAATAGIPNKEQGLAASLFQTSFQVGGAVVLAVITAVIDAGGANAVTTPAATLSAYRPALYLITGIAGLGLLAALPGLRRGSIQLTEDAAGHPVIDAAQTAPESETV